MRRVIVLSIILIFCIQIVPINTALDSSQLDNEGTVADLPSSTLLFTTASPGKWIYVGSQGDVVMYEWDINSKKLIPFWSEKLKKPGENSTLVDLGTINSAAYNSYETQFVNSSSGNTETRLVERIAIGYSETGGGAINIYSIESEGLDKSIANCVCTRKIPTTSGISALAWDTDGKLWYGLANQNYAQKVSPETGINDPEQTTPHANSINIIVVLVDNLGTKWIITGGDDGAFVHDSSGVKVHELSCACTSAVVDLIAYDLSSNAIFVVKSGEGQIRKYDINANDWSTTEQVEQIGFAQIKGLYVNSEGNLIVGTTNKLLFYGASNFSKYDEMPTSNPSHTIVESNNNGMLIVAGNSKNKIWLYDVDSDGDGYSDMSDKFPNDPNEHSDYDNDGVGDNQDMFDDNPAEWLDSDGDGVGDNTDAFPFDDSEIIDTDGDKVGNNADAFPEDINEWSDTDSDEFGDNIDNCVGLSGVSTEDRFGCPDTDGDGYSDPSDNYLSHPYGSADAFPYDETQWRDQDDDGYGDSFDGNKGDQCPSIFGTSNFTLQQEENSTIWVKVPWYGCPDSDGDGYEDVIDRYPDDPTEWIDADNDGVGSQEDYDDYDVSVQTKDEFCKKMEIENKTVAECIEEIDDSIIDESQSANLQVMLGNTDLKTLGMIMGGLFVGLTGGILGMGYLIKLVRPPKKKGIKAPRGSSSIFAGGTEEVTAIDEGGDFSYSGELTGQEYWDDDPMEDKVVNPSMVPDEPELPAPLEDIAVTDSSVESAKSAPNAPPPGNPPKAPPAAAFSESPSTPPAENSPVVVESSQQTGPPPLPPGGLPEGWTEDQWKWYGHEWLEKNS